MLEMCRCLTLDFDIFVLSCTVLEGEHSILNRFFNSFLPSWYNLNWLRSKEFLKKATHCPLQPVISIFVLLVLLGWVLEYLWYEYIYFSDFHFLLSSNNNTGQIIVLILAQEPDNSTEIEFLSQKTAPQCNSLTDKKKKKSFPYKMWFRVSTSQDWNLSTLRTMYKHTWSGIQGDVCNTPCPQPMWEKPS